LHSLVQSAVTPEILLNVTGIDKTNCKLGRGATGIDKLDTVIEWLHLGILESRVDDIVCIWVLEQVLQVRRR
jgi:hypothetical protein